MSRTTTALVLREINGPFSLEPITLGTLQPDEALVEIHATGLCHTDLSCANGTLPAAPNAVFGHEGAGIVLEAGSEVTAAKKGDKVLLSFAHCGDCKQCKEGHPAYCYSFVPLNFSGGRLDGSKAMTIDDDQKPLHSSFFGQSSFARHALVHKSSLVKVPEDTDLNLFAPLGCGMQTGAGAVLNTLNVKEGSSLVVFGVGSVGMSSIMAGKMRKAKVIIAVDLQPGRLELAKKLGATHTVVGSNADVVEQIQKLCPPNGADFALDATGVPAVVGNMIDCLGTRGRAATVGAPAPGKRANVDIFNHLVLGREYVGCCEGDSTPSQIIPYLMEQQKKGEYPLEQLISYYDMKDYEKAIDDTHKGVAIKAVLKWT